MCVEKLTKHCHQILEVLLLVLFWTLVRMPDPNDAHHIFISGILAQNVELVLSSSSFDQRLFCLPVFRLSPSVTTQVTLLNNFCQFIVNDTASLIART